MELTELRDRVLRDARLAQLPALTAEDVDDALNLVQRQLIQPIVRAEASSSYTTTQDSGLESVVIPDMDTLVFVMDESGGAPGYRVAVLNQDDEDDRGVRIYAGTLQMQRLGQGRKLRFYYYRMLKDLGPGPDQVLVPQFAPQWHDLLWMGAAAYLNPAHVQLAGLFRDRLDAFRGERRKAGRSGKRFARVVTAWE